MPFPTQKQDVNNCGAICICYLRWLEAGRTPEMGPQPGDDDMIKDVYKAVMVGNAAVQNLPCDYCDPVKMMEILESDHADVSFYLSEKSEVINILKEMRKPGAPEKDKIDEMEANGKLLYSPPIVPEKGQATIAVYYVVETTGGQLLGMHYLLFRTNEKGQHSCYNPWLGKADHFTGYNDYQCGNLFLSSANAAIVITQKEKTP